MERRPKTTHSPERDKGTVLSELSFSRCVQLSEEAFLGRTRVRSKVEAKAGSVDEEVSSRKTIRPGRAKAKGGGHEAVSAWENDDGGEISGNHDDSHKDDDDIGGSIWGEDNDDNEGDGSDDNETTAMNSTRQRRFISRTQAISRIQEERSSSDQHEAEGSGTGTAELVSLIYAKHDARRHELIRQNRMKLAKFLSRSVQSRTTLFPARPSRWDQQPDSLLAHSHHNRRKDSTEPPPEMILRMTHEIPRGTTWTKVIRSVPVKEQKTLGFSLEEEYDPYNELTTKDIGTYVGDELDDDYARDESIKELFPIEIGDQNTCMHLSQVSNYARIGADSSVKRIGKRWLYLKEAEMSHQKIVEPVSKPENYMSSIRTHFCIMCLTYTCQHHPYMTGYMTKVEHWSRVDHGILEESLKKPPPEGWTKDEWVLLLRGLAIYPQTELASLKDFVFTKTVEDIAECIKKYNLTVEPFPNPPKRPRNLKSGYQVHLLRRNFDSDASTNTYLPCTHSGPCKEDECRCPTSHHLCTKFCRCSPDCQYRFQGCVCKGDCLTTGCRCYSYGFECDPDLCQCGTKCSTSCMNQQLQRNKEKCLYLAKSNLPNAGWGIFLAEKADKNELIQEYTGELLPNPESERRGVIYAIIKRNYIFGLTEEHDIDAAYLGSEVRFANHSMRGTCHPRRLFVAGKYRIGIYASRNLRIGDEVLFDYDYAEEHRKHYGIHG